MKTFLRPILILVVAASLASTFAGQTPPQPKQEKLLNGLKILMWPDASAKMVGVRIRIHSGSSFDPQGREGVMKMLAENIFPETAAREFFTEDLGGKLEIVATYDYIEINAMAKPENFISALETLSAAVASPTIDKPTTEKLRSALLTSVAALEADPAYVADQAVTKRLFGTFPYGRPQLGSAESIRKIDFADLLDAKQRFLTGDNATVAVYGNFDRTLGFRAIRRLFGAWLKSDKRVPSTFRQPDPVPSAFLTVPSPKADVNAVRFAFRGTTRNDKEFAASRVFTNILDARLKARVAAEHAASVFVRNEPHILPGVIIIGLGGQKSSNVNGKVEANEIVGKVLTDAITDAEFAAAKRIFQAEWSRRDVYSFWLDADTFRTIGPEADSRIADAVTLEDVRAYASRAAKQPMAAVLVNTPAAN